MRAHITFEDFMLYTFGHKAEYSVWKDVFEAHKEETLNYTKHENGRINEVQFGLLTNIYGVQIFHEMFELV